MAQRHTVSGRRSVLTWVAVGLVLALAIALVTVVFVIGPERQLAVEATATARARASEVQRAYDAGIAFAAAGDWRKAAEEFARVVAMEPGYKDATQRLAEARTSAAESAYQRGLGYFNLERWEQARAEFEQVIAISPNYKDVQARLVEVETRIAEVIVLTPTGTPVPAYTPMPTPTATPMPPTKTPTPTITPIPVLTKAPTITPSPTPTNTPSPIVTTSPSQILSDGETAHGNGLALTAKFYCALDCDITDDYGPVPVVIDFALRNTSRQKIIIPSFGGDAFVIRLDTGERLYVWTSIHWAERKAYINQQPMNPGAEIKWRWIFKLTNGKGGGVGRPLPIPNEAKSFVLEVPNIGERFAGAQWQGVIPR